MFSFYIFHVLNDLSLYIAKKRYYAFCGNVLNFLFHELVLEIQKIPKYKIFHEYKKFGYYNSFYEFFIVCPRPINFPLLGWWLIRIGHQPQWSDYTIVLLPKKEDYEKWQKERRL